MSSLEYASESAVKKDAVAEENDPSGSLTAITVKGCVCVACTMSSDAGKMYDAGPASPARRSTVSNPVAAGAYHPRYWTRSNKRRLYP